MSALARLLNLGIARYRRQLEQHRRTAVRLLGFDPAADDAGDDGETTAPSEAPRGGVVLRLEHPAGGGRRETR